MEKIKRGRLLADSLVGVVESLIEYVKKKGGDRKCGVSNDQGDIVVPKNEDIVEYAKGYYDRAKDVLQDCVYELGVVGQDYKTTGESGEGTVEREKEDLAHLATIMIWVGSTLEEQMSNEL